MSSAFTTLATPPGRPLTAPAPGWPTILLPAMPSLFPPKDPGGQPLIYLGSYVTEGGHGLAWVDLEGRKQGGQGWLGGAWTGAPYIARDEGPHADAETMVYVAAAWETDLRLTAMTRSGEKQVITYAFPGGKPRPSSPAWPPAMA